jgi:hypothetical protein
MTEWNNKTLDERRQEIRQILIALTSFENAPLPSEDRIDAAVDRIMNNSSPFETGDISSRSDK